MVGIQGIGGPQEPRPDRPSGVRDSRPSASSADQESTGSDGVVLSSEAQAAAAIVKTIQNSAASKDIRTERVEAAKQALNRGDFRRPDVVKAVADRISRLL